MTVEIEYDKKPSWPFDIEKLGAEVVEACLDQEGCPYESEIHILLTDNDSIREINREHRGVDKATDVLSFPMIAFEKPGEFGGIEESGNFHPDTGELLLGDIIISTRKAEEQAEEFGHSIKREYAFLLVHSMLHLTGYDHMSEAEERQMTSRQKQILEFLDIPRE